MNNDSLKMFIMTCCRECNYSPCRGALNYNSRERCKQWNKWTTLSKDKQALLFMKAAAEENIFLEDLIND